MPSPDAYQLGAPQSGSPRLGTPQPGAPRPDLHRSSRTGEGTTSTTTTGYGTISPALLKSQEDRLAPYERAILQMVVRYGEQVICWAESDENGNEGDEGYEGYEEREEREEREGLEERENHEGREGSGGEPITVIDYVVADLGEDDISFRTPIYQRILDEAAAHVHTPGFHAARFFRNHTDPQLSLIATDLMEDRYELSTYHSKYQKIETDEERLPELVPTLLTSYKYAVVGEELRRIEASLQDPVVVRDDARCTQLMTDYAHLRQIQSLMAKQLGDRVVMRV